MRGLGAGGAEGAEGGVELIVGAINASTRPREGGALLERWGKVLLTRESMLTNRDL